ncbi:MAG: Gldg family protein [Verrucomicrobia subdivision 3 bacterium]|nr:Gldg family protein [Limisphaerales bacterium]
MNSPFRNVLTLAKREFTGYFATPVAYVFLVIFLLMTGFFTFMLGMDLFDRNQASLESFFTWHPWLYLFLVPAVAMRLWSEEKRTGTLELLLTLPITAWQAVLAKFLASWAFLVLALALTFPVWITVNKLGSPDNGAIFCAYVGSALMAGAYLAIGCMTSALTRNQVVSFILSVVVCLFTILAGFAPVTNFMTGLFPNSPGVVEFVANLSVITHFEYFQRGVLDFRDLVFFGSVIIFALFVTGIIVRNAQESRTAGNFSYSLGFCGLGALILIAANAMTAQLRWKADLTEGNIYSLSKGTERILLRLNDDRGGEPDAFKLEMRLYQTSDQRVPNNLSRYAKRVEDMLKEYVGLASNMSKGGNESLILHRINVQPDSPEEDQAMKDNIEKFPIGPEEFAYLGLSLSYADRTEKVELLVSTQTQSGRSMSLRSEVTLEYEISHAITRLLKSEDVRVVIGVMAPPTVQVMGGLPHGIPPQMAMQRGMEPRPPWALIRLLQREYDEVRAVDFNSGISRNDQSEEQSLVESDIDMLLVIHPQNISERAQFAIDQYVLNGGKVVAFLDPFYGLSAGAMGGRGPADSSSTLSKLLPAWGLNFDNSHILADMDNPFRPDPRESEVWPTLVELSGKSHSQSEVITQNLGTVSVLHVGSFTGKAADKGLTQVNLLNSSTNAMQLNTKTPAGTATNATAILPRAPFTAAQNKIARTFKGGGKSSVLAVKLTGNFTTAFPQGDPEAIPPADANATVPKDASLKSVRENALPVVVLVGDVDLLNDQLAAQPMRDAFGQFVGFRYSNLTFVMNLADYLTGDEDLIRVRSQSQRDRPLELLDRMLEKATRRVQKDIDLLQKELETAKKKVREIEEKVNEQVRQLMASGGGQLQISEADVKKLKDMETEEKAAEDKARKTIREKKRELREEINALKFRIKWANILIMPALVALFGLFVAVTQSKRSKRSVTLS